MRKQVQEKRLFDLIFLISENDKLTQTRLKEFLQTTHLIDLRTFTSLLQQPQFNFEIVRIVIFLSKFRKHASSHNDRSVMNCHKCHGFLKNKLSTQKHSSVTKSVNTLHNLIPTITSINTTEYKKLNTAFKYT